MSGGRDGRTGGRRTVRVINVSISTVKARKIINSASCLAGGERDAYLRGVRDTIGGDLGWLFAHGAATGDIRAVARFCRDGWRVCGDQGLFTARMDLRTFLLEMRRLCDKACRDMPPEAEAPAK